MELKAFKLSKTGKIIIIIIIAVILLLSLLFYIAYKKQQEINKQEDNETKTEQKQVNATGDDNKLSDNELHTIFNDYRNGKFGYKQAIELSGLSTGSFYRALNKYEKNK